MNYIDLIIVILLGWAFVRGFSRGLVIMVASFAALVIGIWGALRFSGMVADWMTNSLELSTPYIHLVAFTVTFLGIVIAINILALLLTNLISIIALGFINRLLGSFFGVLTMAFVLSVLFMILDAFNRVHEFIPADHIDSSLLYAHIRAIAPAVFPFLGF